MGMGRMALFRSFDSFCGFPTVHLSFGKHHGYHYQCNPPTNRDAQARTLVRTEGIITQLVFEHSLRIRMTAELPEGGDSGNNTVSPTPDSISIAAGSSMNLNEEPTPPSSIGDPESSSGKRKQKDQDIHAPSAKKETPDNLVGKINNLVTTDLANIVEARDFLILSLFLSYSVLSAC